MLKKFIALVLVVSCAFEFATAQKPAFYDEIQIFKKADSLNPPPKNAILFVGSSSFRLWKNLNESFPGYTIINRGFGGSHLPEVKYYANDIIFPYEPKQILIYAGDNDLAEGDSVTAYVVFRRFKELFDEIRTKLPATQILFVAIKPSPSRKNIMPRAAQANLLIRGFLQDKMNTAFIDIYNPMLDENGQPKADIFISDNLHMNEKGYAIWTKIIQPYLIK